MTELKPCPFHKEYIMPHLETGYDEGNGHPESGGYWAAIECPVCNVEMATCEQSTEELAVKAVTEAWNTRFEPTCTMDNSLKETGMLGCSNCGMTTLTLDTIPKYCQHCGAKVTKECTMYRVALYDEEAIESIECSECGWSGFHDHDDPLPEICPNCKAQVIEE